MTVASPDVLVTQTRQATKIQFLEAVRGVAALLVVVQHLVASTLQPYGEWSETNFDLGRVGVVAFFLVSGYVIPLSLAKQGPGTFVMRRFFRLYPVYWLALGSYLILANQVDPFSSTALVANVLMIQGVAGMVSLLPIAWTLSIELLFYAQQLGFKLIGLSRQSAYLGYFWLAVYLSMCAVQILLHKDMPTTLPMLLFVACLGHAIHLQDEGQKGAVTLTAMGVIVVPIGAFFGYDGGEWNPFNYSVSFLGGLALFGLFYIARQLRTPKLLTVLGAWSYALYLFHPIVSEVLAPLKAQTPVVFMVGNLLVVLIVSWAIHHLIEKPSIGLGRALSRYAK